MSGLGLSNYCNSGPFGYRIGLNELNGLHHNSMSHRDLKGLYNEIGMAESCVN
jgi:hypothetical protein